MQIPTPLEKEFEIEWPDVGAFTVVFRQATGIDDDRVLSAEREFNKWHWVELESGERYRKDDVFEPEKVTAEKVRLTLVSCSLEDSGKPLFTPRMARKQFDAPWGQIPSMIRTRIFEKCLEVNPDWVPFWMRPMVEESDSGS